MIRQTLNSLFLGSALKGAVFGPFGISFTVVTSVLDLGSPTEMTVGADISQVEDYDGIQNVSYLWEFYQDGSRPEHGSSIGWFPAGTGPTKRQLTNRWRASPKRVTITFIDRKGQGQEFVIPFDFTDSRVNIYAILGITEINNYLEGGQNDR